MSMIKKILGIATITFLTASAARNIEDVWKTKNIIPVVVIGSGPAGYSAAMQTASAGIPTYVITGHQKGGLLTTTSYVENYPGILKTTGAAIPEIMEQQVLNVGGKILEDRVTAVDCLSWPFKVTTENGLEVRALSLIITTGATPKKLGVPGENTYWGKGVSSCALCDRGFFKKEDVVVVGGGDAAVEQAFELAPYVNSVTILVRSSKMRALHTMQEKLQGNPRIKTIFHISITKIVGGEKGVTAVELLNAQTNKKSMFKTKGVFLAVGQTPNTELFKNQLDLALTGHIVLEGRSQATSIPGIFAAGDVEDSEFRQAYIAAGRGGQAGLEAVRWLQQHMGLNAKMLETNKACLFEAPTL